MPIVSTKRLLKTLPPNMAIGAFNVHNMEYTQAVVAAAEQEKCPVILMLGEPILEFAGLEMLANITRFAAQQSQIPIGIALDHGKKIKNLITCIDLGLSVMVDGSYLPFEDNIHFTREIVLYAKQKNVSVEGELGALAGIEDDNDEQAFEFMTDPEAVVEFVKKTGIDILAISIGNCHGKYIRPPKLDMERLKAIHSKVDIPLVLHGGSDLPEAMSLEAINNGIRKFNIGTDLKYAFCEEMKAVLGKDPMPFQPQDTLGVAREAVKKVAIEKIRLLRNGNDGYGE